MKFVSLSDIRLKSREVWKNLQREKEVVVTSNSKPIALLTGVTEETLERTLAVLRRTRAIQAMEEMQRISVQAGTDQLCDKEIETEIQAARRGRKR